MKGSNLAILLLAIISAGIVIPIASLEYDIAGSRGPPFAPAWTFHPAGSASAGAFTPDAYVMARLLSFDSTYPYSCEFLVVSTSLSNGSSLWVSEPIAAADLWSLPDGMAVLTDACCHVYYSPGRLYGNTFVVINASNG